MALLAKTLLGKLGGPVDKRTSLLELLAEVEPKVAEQNDRLTAQYVAISRLAEHGQDIAEALSVLSQIKELRNALERYRDQIKEELDGR